MPLSTVPTDPSSTASSPRPGKDPSGRPLSASVTRAAITVFVTLAAMCLLVISLNASWFYFDMDTNGEARPPMAGAPVGEGHVSSEQKLYLDHTTVSDNRSITTLGKNIYRWDADHRDGYQNANAMGSRMGTQRVLVILSMLALALNAVMASLFFLGKLPRGVALASLGATLTLLLIASIFLPATLPAALREDRGALLPQYMDDSVENSTASFDAYDVNRSYVTHVAHAIFNVEYTDGFFGSSHSHWSETYESVLLDADTSLTWGPASGWWLMVSSGVVALAHLPLILTGKEKDTGRKDAKYDWVDEELSRLAEGPPQRGV